MRGYLHMSLDIDDMRACIEAHRQAWGAVDEVLYGLCREYPFHHLLRGINAKVILIGRSFATGVERHISSDGTQGSSIGKLAEHLHAAHTEVDETIERLATLREPLNPEKLQVIVGEHGRFCRLISKIAREENALASFASKYLHFHCPVVPIYDSWVCKQAWRMRQKAGLRVFDAPAEAHDGYYWYTLCFWQLYSQVRGAIPDVNVRLAEAYLLWLASRRLALPSAAPATHRQGTHT
jgi:hypothetical protein